MKNFLRKWYPLIIILSVATALRIILLLNRGTFWFDESFSIHFSTLSSWADTWKYWVLETNPPLYTFFLRFYLPLINQSNEILVRLPSLILNLLSIVMLYIFAEKILSRKAAIISSVLLAFSALHIFAGTETRVYSLLFLLSTISCYLFYSLIIEQKNDKKLWTLFAVTNVLLLYSHLTSLVIILIQFLILNISTKNKTLIKNWYIIQFISFALWSIWFIPSILSKLNFNFGNAWFFENPGNILVLLLYPLINSLGNNLLNTVFAIILFAGLYIFVNTLKKTDDQKQKNTLLFIATWALLPIILSSMVGSFTVKYIMIAYPAFFMLAASIIEKYIVNKKNIMIFAIFIIIVFSPPTMQFISKPLFSWNILNDYLDKKDNGKAIILIPFIQEISFKKNYKGNIPMVSLYFKQDNYSLEERVVRYNWQIQNATKEEIYNFISVQVEKNLANKIFLLTQRDKFQIVADVMLEHRWTITDKSPSAGLDNYIIEFNAPNNNTTSTIGLPKNR